MDPLLIGLGGGFAAAFVSGLSAVIVALINSRKERTNSAEASADEVMEQRLLLRDEQNQQLRRQNVSLQSALDDCISENTRLRSDK